MNAPLNPQKPASAAPAAQHEGLPIGTRFGELEILRVIGVGGFGIVYLAFDHSLEREVALKEYMPASLASRGEGAQVTVRSGALAETYAIGLRSFVNEARLLARFDHPSLVKVYRFWEDNATAYMVMPYLQGRTVRDSRRLLSQSPDEAWIRSVVDPMLSALEALHREGVFHRDIAPDNILLPPLGPPVLLDFGAARHVINDRTQTLTAIFKPSYAPIEQYGEMTSLRQGAWTDLYALGAVVHFLLRGAPPAPATARAIHDAVVPLASESFPGVSPQFLKAIDWALAVRPHERPQSADELRAAIEGRIPVPAPVQHDTNLDGSALVPGPATTGNATTAAAAPAAAAATQAARPAPAAAVPTPATAPARTQHAPVPPPSPAPTQTAVPPTRTGKPPPASLAWIDEADEVTKPPPPRTGIAGAPAPKPFDPDDTVVLSKEEREQLVATAKLQLTSAQPLVTPSLPVDRTAQRAGTGTTTTPSLRSSGKNRLVATVPQAPHAAAEPSQKPMPAWALALGGVVAVGVLAGAAYWKFSGPSSSAPAAPAPVQAEAPPPPAPAPAPTPAPAPVAEAPAPVAPPVATTPAPEPVAATPSPAPAPVAPPPVAAAPSTTPTAGAPEVKPPAGVNKPSDAEAAAAAAAKAKAAKAEAAKLEAAKAEAKRAEAAAKAKAAKAAQHASDPVPNKGVATAPAPVPVAAPKPAEAPPPAPAGPATAREACGDRVFISLALCMQRECEKPRYRENPECVKMAEEVRRRREQ